MPHYRFRCDDHGEWDEWQSIHIDIHSSDCGNCGTAGVQVMTPPRISVYALEHKGDDVKDIDRREAAFAEDGPAYARLRKDGLQPKSVNGSAMLETFAHDRVEVEMGHKVDPGDLEKVRDVRAELKEGERTGATQALGEYVRKRGKVTA